MSETAIVMAAGLGSRMRPLTERIAKPLVRVHGRPMVETVLDALRTRGVEDISLVSGYKAEQFAGLDRKYPGLRIVYNAEYDRKNNISSLYAAADALTYGDCFICEADLYIPDKHLLCRKLDGSGYFGRMVAGHSDDWVFYRDEDGRISRITKGGDDLYNMVGISYFTRKDAGILREGLLTIYEQEESAQLFWDELTDRLLDRLSLCVYPVEDGEIVEIDSMEELSAVDESYR